MEKEKKELQTVIKKIEDLQSSLKSKGDFFKQKFIFCIEHGCDIIKK